MPSLYGGVLGELVHKTITLSQSIC